MHREALIQKHMLMSVLMLLQDVNILVLSRYRVYEF